MALYPAAALLASNLGQVRPTLAYRAMALSIVATGLAMAVLRVPLHDWRSAALLTTWGLFLFYSYGHVYNALRVVEIGGGSLGRHRYLVPLWAGLAAGGGWWILRRIGTLRWLTPALNVGLGLALLLPLSQAKIFSAEQAAASEIQRPELQALPLPLTTNEVREPPDIYFIVLDAYTSEAVLREQFDLDNRPFVDELQQMGFYVAGCSQSNYSQTELSLVSTLNMAYLSDLIDESIPGDRGRPQLWPLLRHPAVRNLMEASGYRSVAFETGYYWSEWEDADLYLAPKRGLFQGLSAFEATLLRSTAAWALVDALPQLPSFLLRDLDRSAQAHRQRLLYVLDELQGLAEVPGPKFVFAHIVSPHRPFVFDAQGNAVDDNYDWSRSHLGEQAYQAGYRQQVLYLNSRLLTILKRIIEVSPRPPVIVMQGDHGPEEASSQDRMRIINAYYLAGGLQGLYPSITPVNSFRVILASIFDAELLNLDDLSFFSTYDAPFDYSLVDNHCSS